MKYSYVSNNGVLPVGLASGVEPLVTEEPDEGNLHTYGTVGGGPFNRCSYPEEGLAGTCDVSVKL